MLNLPIDGHSIYTPNVSIPLQGQIGKIKRVAKDSEVIAAALNISSLGKIFNTFGFSLLGWLMSLLQSLVMVIVIAVVVCIVISCIKYMVTQSVSTVKQTPLNPAPETDVPLNPACNLAIDIPPPVPVHLLDVPIKP